MQVRQVWLLWFVAFSAMARAERDSGENAASKTVDDVSENMHVELLQRDLKLSHRGQQLENPAKDEVTVHPWKCAAGSEVAYQSTTTNDNSWTKFKESGKAATAAWHDGFACSEKIAGIDKR